MFSFPIIIFFKPKKKQAVHNPINICFFEAELEREKVQEPILQKLRHYTRYIIVILIFCKADSFSTLVFVNGHVLCKDPSDLGTHLPL